MDDGSTQKTVPTQEALRVNQLDASELDVEIFQLMQQKIQSAFKYFKPNILVQYGPELNAALKFILWKYTVNAHEATVGQQLLELRYLNNNSSSRQNNSSIWMTPRQKQLYAFCVITGSWLEERLDDMSARLREYSHGSTVIKLADWLIGTSKVLALVNFLVFLSRGKYLSVMERLLGIRSVFPRPQGVRQVGFEYMDRELLWHGFAEFLFFVIPLININKVKNFVLRQLMSAKSEVCREQSDYTQCVICNEWPNMPREIGCKHVFCYFCLQSNYMVDQSYSCPLCGHRVESPDQIQPVIMKATSEQPS